MFNLVFNFWGCHFSDEFCLFTGYRMLHRLTATTTSNDSGNVFPFILAIRLTSLSAFSFLCFAYSHLGDSGRTLGKERKQFLPQAFVT